MSAKDVKDLSIPITLDKERHLLYDFNAYCELEEEYGSIQKAFEVLKTGSMKVIRKLLWVGLVHEDEGLTEKEVGHMINLNNMTDVVDLISEAIGEALPEAKNFKTKTKHRMR